MFFNQDDDDQDFLSPTGGSKLASLFGMDQASSQGGNESLRYSAPKEPKKKKPGESEEPAAAASAGPSVLHAAAAHCYKYVDGKYASQGKLGVAVIGNHAAQDYKILLYVSKEKQVTHAHITTAFNLTILPNKYVSFYDDMRQGWSVMFDTQDNVTAFAKHVALAKSNSAGPALDALVCQDLVLGEGGPLESNDSAEIKYTGNLLQNHTFGEEFDSNVNADKLFRFKLGKGKVIKGWEEGVLGMKKLGRRLLVVPPSLGYGTSGMGSRVPPSATLIFDIEVIRVKLAKTYTEPEQALTMDSGQTAATSAQDKEPVPTSASTTDTEGESVKARTKSISDQLSQSKSDKAKLISRMAKMGKPMIPLSGAATADHDDSDDENMDSINPGQISPKPTILPKPATIPTAVPVAAVPAATVLPPQQPIIDHSIQAQQMVAQQAAMMGQPMAAQVPQSQPINTSAVFQGVQMPSQMAVYQPPQQQFINPYQQAQYGFQQQQYPGGPQQAPTPPPPAASDVHTPVLLSEARQQNTEVRLSLSKLQDKVEKIHEKLDHINNSQSGQGMALGIPGGMPMMETSILLHSIQRIVQENERLKKEIFEKNARVESQNDKISDLLQRNQKYMEQSNTMLEQRNDSFKSSAEQSQTRLLQLEQERVTLVTELASERSQVGTLQLEVANIKKREIDLRAQLESLVNSSETHREDFSSLRAEKEDLSGKLDHLTSSLKEERLNRKQLEGQLSTLQEDLADLKVTNENLEKNLAERKKKALSDKKRLEEEIEEIKAQHEEEISSLKDKLRKQKSSIDATASEQVAEAEEELSREWKDKCDRLLATAEEKHQRALEELEQEKEQVEEQLAAMEKKAAQAKTDKGDTNKKVEQLQGEVDSLKAWKDKYENVRTQAAAMKDRYEERIADMEAEKDKIIKDAQEAINRARAGGGGGGASKEALVSEVKKIMNSVYHDLKKEFDSDKSYKGADIHGVILNTVKNTTMAMVQSQEEESGGVEEDMEVAAVAGKVSAPVSGGKKDAKPAAAKGGFSLADLESNIMTGDATDDKGKQAKSPAAKKSKPDSETVPVVAMVTGDKGNPYYAEELRQAAEKAKAEQAKLQTGKGQVKESKVDPVVAPITGDKGNPYYAEELRKAAEAAKAGKGSPEKGAKDEVVKPAQASTTASAPSQKPVQENVEKPVSMQTTASAPPPAKAATDPKAQKVTAGVCGDKGNPYYAEELRQAAEAAKDKAAKEKAEKAPITGDKGNPYYAAELEGKTLENKTPDPPKRSEKEVLAGLEASMLAFTDVAKKVDDAQTKKEKDSDNKNQKEKKEEKKDDKSKDKAKGGAAGDKKKSTDKKGSLFDDDSDDDMFATKPAKKDQKDKTPAAAAKKPDDKKAAPAKKGSDSEDDLRKPPPPPLFGDEEEDDDWLS